MGYIGPTRKRYEVLAVPPRSAADVAPTVVSEPPAVSPAVSPASEGTRRAAPRRDERPDR
jgi:hypothetical protein